MPYAATVFAEVRDEINPYTLRRGTRRDARKALEEIYAALAGRFGVDAATSYFGGMAELAMANAMVYLGLADMNKGNKQLQEKARQVDRGSALMKELVDDLMDKKFGKIDVPKERAFLRSA